MYFKILKWHLTCGAYAFEKNLFSWPLLCAHNRVRRKSGQEICIN